jgi:4-amino-4-deoxy-L-arabinose transferase-like glycosyltransferase
MYLAVWSVLGLDSVTWHRIASCFLGTAAVVVIGLVGRRIGGNVVGLLAAGIAALYPEMWINDGMLLSEPMAILTASVAILAMYGFARRPTMRNALWMGLACGFVALTRTELILLFVVAVIRSR